MKQLQCLTIGTTGLGVEKVRRVGKGGVVFALEGGSLIFGQEGNAEAEIVVISN